MATQNKPASVKLNLDAQGRTVFGKKLRKFRHQGLVPANVFGPDFKSTSVSVQLKDFSKVFKVAEETGIIYLKLDKQELPVLVRGVQRHPVKHNLLHIDFRKVDLKQKIETEVPLKTVGESEAVEQKGGVLLTQANEVKVESLPEDIPHEIEVDISALKEIGDEIKVSSLAKSDKYTIKEDAEKVLVSVIAHKEESLIAETAVVEPEVITEAPVEGEEVPAEAEGTEPARQAKPSDKVQGKPAEGKPLDEARGKQEEGKQEKQPKAKAPEQKKE